MSGNLGGAHAVSGRNYIAIVRVWSSNGDETLADVGERCDRVPASRLPWLIETGRVMYIETPPCMTAEEWAALERPEDEE